MKNNGQFTFHRHGPQIIILVVFMCDSSFPAACVSSLCLEIKIQLYSATTHPVLKSEVTTQKKRKKMSFIAPAYETSSTGGSWTITYCSKETEWGSFRRKFWRANSPVRKWARKMKRPYSFIVRLLRIIILGENISLLSFFGFQIHFLERDL